MGFVHDFTATHPLNPLLSPPRFIKKTRKRSEVKREGDFQNLEPALPLLFIREGGGG